MITTHVLDTGAGRPGAGIAVELHRRMHSTEWETIARGVTNIDGRITDLLSVNHAFLPGHYQLVFETGPYFLNQNIECFFPRITIGFEVKDSQQHYHVPVLLSPFGYTTYRGS